MQGYKYDNKANERARRAFANEGFEEDRQSKKRKRKSRNKKLINKIPLEKIEEASTSNAEATQDNITHNNTIVLEKANSDTAISLNNNSFDIEVELGGFDHHQIDMMIDSAYKMNDL